MNAQYGAEYFQANRTYDSIEHSYIKEKGTRRRTTIVEKQDYKRHILESIRHWYASGPSVTDSFLEAWELLLSFKSCSVEVVPYSDEFLMCLWGGRWSPCLTPLPSSPLNHWFLMAAALLRTDTSYLLKFRCNSFPKSFYWVRLTKQPSWKWF